MHIRIVLKIVYIYSHIFCVEAQLEEKKPFFQTYTYLSQCDLLCTVKIAFK